MKNITLFLGLLLSFYTLQAQPPMGMMDVSDGSPVSWNAEVQKQSDDRFNLIFKAKIAAGWHIFSQHTPDGGSMPMEITYLKAGEGYQLNGDTEESPTIRQYNDIFEVDEIIWEDNAILTQSITLDNPDTRYIKAEMAYQVCAEMCINEEYHFVFDLKDKTATVYENYD